MLKLKLLRRCLQITWLLIIIFIPICSFITVHVHNRGRDIPLPRQNFPLSKTYRLINSSEKMLAIADIPKGSQWSFTIGKVTISDPLPVLKAMAADGRFTLFLLATALLPFLLTLIFGRVFCGWLCPADLMFEMNHKLRTILQRIGFCFQDISLASNTKYAVLVGGLLIGLIGGMSVFHLLYPPVILARELFYYYFYGMSGIGALLLLLLLFVEMLFAPRLWCRSLCPGGALYSLIGRRRVLRVTNDHLSCNGCKKCLESCQFALNPMSGEGMNVCNNCGECIAACHSKSLRYKFASPLLPVEQRDRRDFLKKAIYNSAIVVASSLGVSSLLNALPVDKHGGKYHSRLLRPPGAIDEKGFNLRCIQCFKCAQVCPRGCISFGGIAQGKNLNTPFIIPGERGCDLCMKCTQVCPSGALLEIDKHKINMGKAYIDKNLCYPWSDRGFCGACKTICPRHAIEEGFKTRPLLDIDKCVGCGMCEEVCPVDLKAIKVERR